MSGGCQHEGDHLQIQCMDCFVQEIELRAVSKNLRDGCAENELLRARAEKAERERDESREAINSLGAELEEARELLNDARWEKGCNCSDYTNHDRYCGLPKMRKEIDDFLESTAPDEEEKS